MLPRRTTHPLEDVANALPDPGMGFRWELEPANADLHMPAWSLEAWAAARSFDVRTLAVLQPWGQNAPWSDRQRQEHGLVVQAKTLLDALTVCETVHPPPKPVSSLSTKTSLWEQLDAVADRCQCACAVIVVNGDGDGDDGQLRWVWSWPVTSMAVVPLRLCIVIQNVPYAVFPGVITGAWAIPPLCREALEGRLQAFHRRWGAPAPPCADLAQLAWPPTGAPAPLRATAADHHFYGSPFSLEEQAHWLHSLYVYRHQAPRVNRVQRQLAQQLLAQLQRWKDSTPRAKWLPASDALLKKLQQEDRLQAPQIRQVSWPRWRANTAPATAPVPPPRAGDRRVPDLASHVVAWIGLADPCYSLLLGGGSGSGPEPARITYTDDSTAALQCILRCGGAQCRAAGHDHQARPAHGYEVPSCTPGQREASWPVERQSVVNSRTTGHPYTLQRRLADGHQDLTGFATVFLASDETQTLVGVFPGHPLATNPTTTALMTHATAAADVVQAFLHQHPDHTAVLGGHDVGCTLAQMTGHILATRAAAALEAPQRAALLERVFLTGTGGPVWCTTDIMRGVQRAFLERHIFWGKALLQAQHELHLDPDLARLVAPLVGGPVPKDGCVYSFPHHLLYAQLDGQVGVRPCVLMVDALEDPDSSAYYRHVSVVNATGQLATDVTLRPDVESFMLHMFSQYRPLLLKLVHRMPGQDDAAIA